jgi:hypothetical protein
MYPAVIRDCKKGRYGRALPFAFIGTSKGGAMQKKILKQDRVRKIEGGFSYVPHRFVTDGYLEFLSQKELLLYLFLVIVCDRHGLSYYSYDRICTILELDLDEYIETRDALIRKDLIAFDGTLFQVLELPSLPVKLNKAASHA